MQLLEFNDLVHDFTHDFLCVCLLFILIFWFVYFCIFALATQKFLTALFKFSDLVIYFNVLKIYKIVLLSKVFCLNENQKLVLVFNRLCLTFCYCFLSCLRFICFAVLHYLTL